MKKFNLVIVALLVLSVSAFAVDVTPSASVTGEASVAFTYDLDGNFLDIDNSASASLSIELIASTSVSEGEGEVVGYIALTGISAKIGANVDTGEDDADGNDIYAAGAIVSSPAVEAKIYLMGPALYVDIIKGSVKTDNATAPDFGLVTETVAGVSYDAAPVGTIGLGYVADEFNVKVTVGDNADGATAFDFGVMFALTAVDGLTFNAGLAADNNFSGFGYGATVGYALDVASVTVGYDGDGAANEVSAKVSADFGATVDVAFGTDLTSHDLMVTLASGSLVEDVAVSVVAEIPNFDFAALGVKATASASLGVVSPYAEYSIVLGGVQTLKIGAGLALIENVDMDLKYETSDLGNVNGKIVFTTKIAY